jgi:hypothetical protein
LSGGQGAFIGAVHRIASRIDDRYELVAGCLSSTPNKALLSAKEIGIDSSRSYPDFKSMAEAEASREDGIEVVSIVTPNHMHASPSIEFLKKGLCIYFRCRNNGWKLFIIWCCGRNAGHKKSHSCRKTASSRAAERTSTFREGTTRILSWGGGSELGHSSWCSISQFRNSHQREGE